MHAISTGMGAANVGLGCWQPLGPSPLPWQPYGSLAQQSSLSFDVTAARKVIFPADNTSSFSLVAAGRSRPAAKS